MIPPPRCDDDDDDYEEEGEIQRPAESSPAEAPPPAADDLPTIDLKIAASDKRTTLVTFDVNNAVVVYFSSPPSVAAFHDSLPATVMRFLSTSEDGVAALNEIVRRNDEDSYADLLLDHVSVEHAKDEPVWLECLRKDPLVLPRLCHALHHPHPAMRSYVPLYCSRAMTSVPPEWKPEQPPLVLDGVVDAGALEYRQPQQSQLARVAWVRASLTADVMTPVTDVTVRDGRLRMVSLPSGERVEMSVAGVREVRFVHTNVVPPAWIRTDISRWWNLPSVLGRMVAPSHGVPPARPCREISVT